MAEFWILFYLFKDAMLNVVAISYIWLGIQLEFIRIQIK